MNRLDEAFYRRFWAGPAIAADMPQPPAPAADSDAEWRNPTVEDWASVSGRTPVTLPKMGGFPQALADAEELLLDELAALTACHDPWTAARLAFTPTEEGSP